MIGDGMGSAQRKAAQWYSTGRDQTLSMDSLPVRGYVRTAALDSEITDSAASGTALATGIKTETNHIAVTPDNQPLTTILEHAQKQGKSVGLITNVMITDATPAAFAAHIPDRTLRGQIALMILEHKVDVLLGGGEDDFLPSSLTGCYPGSGNRKDGRNLIEEARQEGYTYVCTAEELHTINPEAASQVLGLFGDEGMKRPNKPSLQEMTQTALAILSQNPQGFFLMVEGGLIDWACHANEAQLAIQDTLAFDQAVSRAISFAEAQGDTLLIVTADHEAGGMSVSMNSQGFPDEDGPFSMPGRKLFYVNWSTDYHTGADVPLTAMGPGADLLSGTYDNTHIFDVMFLAIGERVP
jgi:alkaline phosphatase